MELHLREIEIRILKTVCVWWELHQTSGMFLACSLKPVDRHSLQNRNHSIIFFSSHLSDCFSLIVNSKSKYVIHHFCVFMLL